MTHPLFLFIICFLVGNWPFIAIDNKGKLARCYQTSFLHGYFVYLIFHPQESFRQVFDDVAGDEAFFSYFLDSEVAGKTVKIHA